MGGTIRDLPDALEDQIKFVPDTETGSTKWRDPVSFKQPFNWPAGVQHGRVKGENLPVAVRLSFLNPDNVVVSAPAAVYLVKKPHSRKRTTRPEQPDHKNSLDFVKLNYQDLISILDRKGKTSSPEPNPQPSQWHGVEAEAKLACRVEAEGEDWCRW